MTTRDNQGETSEPVWRVKAIEQAHQLAKSKVDRGYKARPAVPPMIMPDTTLHEYAGESFVCDWCHKITTADDWHAEESGDQVCGKCFDLP